MATPRRRAKSQLPECYYEGFLEKRSFKDKIARKLWTSLCGSSLFFFNNSKDNNYVEKVDLSDFVNLTDDSSYDRNLDAARLQLELKDETVQLTAPTLEARELWKGFIFSVVELTVPSSLNLLPGQIHMMKEVVDKEKMRRKALPSPPATATANGTAAITVATQNTSAQNNYLCLVSEMPACYQQVSRAESELILERNQEKGNLLLRPGRDGSSFAVTTRQDLNGAVFRHYRVTRNHEGGFSIAVENPIHCDTLHDVINCLVEKTGGVLKPLVLEEAYEKSIMYVENNKESGEKSIICASNNSGPPLPTASKPAQRARLPSPPASEPESLYLIPAESISDEEADEVDVDAFNSSPVQQRAPVRPFPHQTSLPEGLKISPGGALLPPNHPVSSNRPRSMSDTPKARPKSHLINTLPTKTGIDTLPIGLSEELKEKLKKRHAVSE